MNSEPRHRHVMLSAELALSVIAIGAEMHDLIDRRRHEERSVTSGKAIATRIAELTDLREQMNLLIHQLRPENADRRLADVLDRLRDLTQTYIASLQERNPSLAPPRGEKIVWLADHRRQRPRKG
jgi:hypothetical protein